jgi:hypothetical protein
MTGNSEISVPPSELFWLKGIAEEIKALKSTERYLKKTLDDWQHRRHQAKPGQRSHLPHGKDDEGERYCKRYLFAYTAEI